MKSKGEKRRMEGKDRIGKEMRGEHEEDRENAKIEENREGGEERIGKERMG